MPVTPSRSLSPSTKASLPHVSFLLPYLLILFVNIAIRESIFVCVILFYHRMFVERDAKWPLENSLLGHQIAAQFFNPFPVALRHPSSSSPPCLACILLISPPVISALVSPYSIPLPPNSASPFFSLFDSQNHRWVVFPEVL